MGQVRVSYELRDRVALVTMDDGKANALSLDLVAELHSAFDRAEPEAGAVILAGRPGRFCAGFDLATMRSGPGAVRQLVGAGAELLVRMCEFPLPMLAACTGHALAAGALLLLAADRRVGERGEFKIGLNEVAIGMTLPHFAMELARQRLSRRHLIRATAQAEIYRPDDAVDAGYLDCTVGSGELSQAAFSQASRLAQAPQPAFRNTKQRAHAPMLATIRERLEEELETLAGPAPS